ncbi:MAG: flagellar export chaperone FliS [Methylococcales bacterium]|jgi:flagellar protein FliS|nr:flagellar export chaperone FliS [Methylococcales bacterium]MBT7410696.1 flagellar export chaperone FliS [Methylococcales bacterium]
MSYARVRAAMKSYGEAAVQSDVNCASPHRLIQMLMEGALEKISKARGFMQRGEITEKGNHISWALSIINGLRMSLDKEAGGEIAQNLDDLYDYMARCLLEANVKNSEEKLDEVSKLLIDIKGAWDVIPDGVKSKTRDQLVVDAKQETN